MSRYRGADPTGNHAANVVDRQHAAAGPDRPADKRNGDTLTRSAAASTETPHDAYHVRFSHDIG